MDNFYKIFDCEMEPDPPSAYFNMISKESHEVKSIIVCNNYYKIIDIENQYDITEKEKNLISKKFKIGDKFPAHEFFDLDQYDVIYPEYED